RATTVTSGTQVTATIPSSDIATSGSAQVKVSNPGTADSNALTFTINAVPPPSPASLQSLTLNPSSVAGGQTSTASVTLSAAAPEGGATVTLSSDSLFAIVPGS